MAFVFVIIGAVLITAGIRNKQGDLWKLVQKDFSPTLNPGQNVHSFLPWLSAILVIGAIGYIEDLKPLSRAFLVLVIIVLFLSNNGFFSQLQQSIQKGK